MVPAFILLSFVIFLFTNCDGVKFDKGPAVKNSPQIAPTPNPAPAPPTTGGGASSGGSSSGGSSSGSASSSGGGSSGGSSPACTDHSGDGPIPSGGLCHCDCGCTDCEYVSDDCNQCPIPNDVVYSSCTNDPGKTIRHCK